MAKKTNENKTVEIQDTTTPVGYEYTLAATVEATPGLSLRRIAASLDLNYNMLLKQGKKAREGEVYNPEVINYDAVEDYIRAKLGGPEDYDAINWQDVAQADVSRDADASAFNEGDEIFIRGTTTGYTIAIKTETHVVLLPCDGTSTQPRLFSIPTFMHQGPKLANGFVAPKAPEKVEKDPPAKARKPRAKKEEPKTES